MFVYFNVIQDQTLQSVANGLGLWMQRFSHHKAVTLELFI